MNPANPAPANRAALLGALRAKVLELEDLARNLEQTRPQEPRLTYIPNSCTNTLLLLGALFTSSMILLLLSGENRVFTNTETSSDAVASSHFTTKEIVGITLLLSCASICFYKCLRSFCCTPTRENGRYVVEHRNDDAGDLEMNVLDYLAQTITMLRGVNVTILLAAGIALPTEDNEINHSRAEGYIKKLLEHYRGAVIQHERETSDSTNAPTIAMLFNPPQAGNNNSNPNPTPTPTAPSLMNG